MKDLLRNAAALVALLVFVAPIAAQEEPPHQPVNADLEQSEGSEKPKGWRFSSSSGATVTLDDESPFAGSMSARIDAENPKATGRRFSNLMQSLDATPWRGKRIRYRAAVRARALGRGSTVQLWLRVDRPRGKPRPAGAFDNMADRPIRSAQWQQYDIVVDVADDAEGIALGVFVLGTGKAWFDAVSLEEVSKDVATTSTTRRSSTLSPLVRKALAEAETAPRQPFWTAWLALPLLALTLFVIGLWPPRRVDSAGAASGPDIAPAAIPAADDERVGVLRSFAFRVTLAYWLIYCLPGPLDRLVGMLHADTGAMLARWHLACEAAVASFTAKHVFGIETALVPPNGSGDTTQSYLIALSGFVLALLVASVWTVVRRSMRSRTRALQADLLRSYLRYVLAFAMLGYGLAKVSLGQNQFPIVSSMQLEKTWGDSSPMNVVWAFMGASRPYTIFAGLGEILGASLLIWRRTATLGALVTLGVMTNIVMLNYCYDVPVKLYSTHLLAMAALIAVPDVRRLLRVFLWNRTAAPFETISIWDGAILRWARRLLKTAVIVFAFALPLGERATQIYEQVTAPSPAGQEPRAGKQYRLTSRGYRWINEVPFNR